MINSHHRPTYKRYRFPREIIDNTVRLYFNINLSNRDVPRSWPREESLPAM
jgi:transposase-like protein